MRLAPPDQDAPIRTFDGHFPVQARGKADQALAVFPQQCLVDAGLVIETFEIALGDKLHEILIAAFVLAQDDQMIRSAARGIAILVIGFRDVHLAADDRL